MLQAKTHISLIFAQSVHRRIRCPHEEALGPWLLLESQATADQTLAAASDASCCADLLLSLKSHFIFIIF